MPRLERDWLSCTNSPRMPSSSKTERRKVSTKKPRSSPSTLGAMSATRSIRVSRSRMKRRSVAAAPERPNVGDEVADQPRVDARGAELLGLHAAADLRAGQHAALSHDGLDRPLEELRGGHLEEVDARLEAVQRRQRLTDQEVPLGEVVRDPV